MLDNCRPDTDPPALQCCVRGRRCMTALILSRLRIHMCIHVCICGCMHTCTLAWTYTCTCIDMTLLRRHRARRTAEAGRRTRPHAAGTMRSCVRAGVASLLGSAMARGGNAQRIRPSRSLLTRRWRLPREWARRVCEGCPTGGSKGCAVPARPDGCCISRRRAGGNPNPTP